LREQDSEGVVSGEQRISKCVLNATSRALTSLGRPREFTCATMVSEATTLSKDIVATMRSEVIVTTMWSNNDLGSHFCNQEGGSTGVSGPWQGTGEEVRGAKPLEQQALADLP
jgi:hypothetical protein